MQGNRILYAGIMSIKGDDVFYTHAYQLLKCSCTVQGFSAVADVLAAFIQVWHDYIYSAGLSADCADHTF